MCEYKPGLSNVYCEQGCTFSISRAQINIWDHTFTPVSPSRGIVRYRTEITTEIAYQDPRSTNFTDNGRMNIKTYYKR